jgi:hypothetical protein
MRKAHLISLFLIAFSFALPLGSVAAERPEYLSSFDPAKGFKPAQRDLTEVFLQIAGSLEYYGSPVPYLQHMAQEHERIEALYLAKFGTAPKSLRPAYMTDEYLSHLASNWNYLSPKLGLDPYAKEVGNTMRDAINGTRGTGTMIVSILNEHQSQVYDSMAGKGGAGADFDTLKSELVSKLELNNPSIDDANYSIPQRDAVRSAMIIHGITDKLFAQLDQKLKPADSERIKTAILTFFVDVGQMGQSEIQVGFLEAALQQSTAAK